MQKNVLLEFLEFLLKNHINLTINEKTILKNITENTTTLTKEDLITWYYSAFRKNKKAINLLKNGLKIEIFRIICTLNEIEINFLLKYQSRNAFIYYATLKEYTKDISKNKQDIISKYNFQIVELLMNSKYSFYKLDLIISTNLLYENLDLIKKLCNLNIDEASIYIIKSLTELFKNYSSIITMKFIEIFINNPREIPIFIDLSEEEIKIICNDERIVNAILKQTTYIDIENVIYNALYQNKLDNNQENMLLDKEIENFFTTRSTHQKTKSLIESIKFYNTNYN